jgi:hypothetical protein
VQCPSGSNGLRVERSVRDRGPRVRVAAAPGRAAPASTLSRRARAGARACSSIVARARARVVARARAFARARALAAAALLGAGSEYAARARFRAR